MQKAFRFATLASLALCFGATSAKGATLTWTGGGADTLITNATNWGGTAPVAGDIVIFNGSTVASPNVTINTAPPIYSQLRIINGANVTVECFGAFSRALSVNSTGALDSGTEAFLLDTGCSLQMKTSVGSTAGTAAFTLTVAATSKANIKGTLWLNNGATRFRVNLAPLGASGVTFRSGSKCYAASDVASATANVGIGGAPGGSPASVNGGIVFESGSEYIHGLRPDLTRSAANFSNPFAETAPNSDVTFQTGSKAIFYQGSGFVTTGRTYADLVLRCNSAQTGNGVPAAIANLNIENNGTGTQYLVSFGGTTGFTISGALTVDSDSGGFEDAATGARTIAVTGGVAANGALSLGTNATLNANVVVGSAGSISATGNGGVLGSIARPILAATGSYNFPVKSAAANREVIVDFTAAPSAGNTLTVDYISASPGTNGLPLVDGALTCDNIDPDGYVSVTAPSAVDGTYDISLNAAGVTPQFSDPTQARLAKRANSAAAWVLEGTAGASAGTVIEQAGLTGFSEFAIVGPSSQVPVSMSAFSIE